ncbi:acyltransferase-domain-containing protein [Blastocladiella britannica]|nr:acyltransferase-domain-containing protein [Blastocladiella britannica]
MADLPPMRPSGAPRPVAQAVAPAVLVIPKVSSPSSKRHGRHHRTATATKKPTSNGFHLNRNGDAERDDHDPSAEDTDQELEDDGYSPDSGTARPAEHSGELANIADSKGLGRFRHDPIRFMIRLSAEGSAFWSGSGWRKYDNYIGAKILYPTYREDITRAVRNHAAVRAAVESEIATQVRAGRDRDQVTKAVKRTLHSYTNTLVADLSSPGTLRFVAFIINNLLVRLYHQGIYIKGREWLALRKAAKAAEEQGISLLFLPCHKSHMDYLLISYIFYRLGIALPHIAAGQNLNIPVVGNLLKKGGAFFIRRSFGNDQMYNAIFKAYIEVLLQRGHNVEAFVEGTRSRTGKLLPPKFGVLKIVMDAVRAGRVKDVIVVPMSIGYDKIVETESYVNELLGRPKEPESLGQLASSTSVLQLKLGRIDVRFATPWSMRAWVDAEVAARTPGQSPFAAPGGGSSTSSPTLLRALGYRVLSDINAVAVVMPTALVATVILTLRGRGVGRTDLVTKVDWVRDQILAKGGKVAEFGDATDIIVDRVLALLGSELIGERKELMEPVYFVKKRFELSLYRNQALHHFVTEAILCASIEVAMREQRVGATTSGSQSSGLLGSHGEPHAVPAATGVSYHQLLRDVSFLSQLFKREFIYPPGGVLDNMNRTLKLLVSNGVLSSVDRILDREKFDFYNYLIWPFVETYWLACLSLLILDPTRSWLDEDDRLNGTNQGQGQETGAGSSDPTVAPVSATWFMESQFADRAQDLAKTLYYEGELTYFESINKEILKNAWTSFAEAGIIEYVRDPAASVPSISGAAALPIDPTSTAKSKTPVVAPGMGGTHVALARDWHPAKTDRLVHKIATLHRFRRDKDGVLRYIAHAGLAPRIRRVLVKASDAMGAGFATAPVTPNAGVGVGGGQGGTGARATEAEAAAMGLDSDEKEEREALGEDEDQDVIGVPESVPVPKL